MYFKGLEKCVNFFRTEQRAKMLNATDMQMARANLPSESYMVNLFHFLAEAGIHLVKTDKNAGSLAWSRELHHEQTMIHLNDANTYQRIEFHSDGSPITARKIFEDFILRFDKEMAECTKDLPGLIIAARKLR